MAIAGVLLCAAAARSQDWKPSPAPTAGFQALEDSGKIQSAFPRFGSFVHDELLRTYSYYVPFNMPTNPVPVVVVLHGGGTSAVATQYLSHEGRWNDLADIHKFIVLYPEGRPDPSNSSKHRWNDCRNDDTDPESKSVEDDVGFIDVLLDWVSVTYLVDPSRVYVTGPSNGGMMTYRLAAELPHRFAAAATILANEPKYSECAAPTQRMPMLIMNGTDDTLMHYDGGCIGVCSAGGGEVLSTDETVAIWTLANQIESEPTVTMLPDLDPDDKSTVTLIAYTNTVTGSEVLLYRVEGGGHRIPGKSDDLTLEPYIGVKNRDIRAPDEIWAFFTRHVKSED